MRYSLLLLVLPAFLGADWLQFRGSENNPVAADQKLPTKFSDTENVVWKSPLSGRGVSGPIVVGDRIFLTASSGPVVEDRLHVLAFDAKSGKQLWHRQVWATGRPFHHPESANAAPTPASDGQRIFAFYSSNDLVCLDLDANLLWYRGLGLDYPKAGNDVGMSSSPLVTGDTVIVQVECQGDSFAAGIDTTTGENRWRIDRPKGANWVSPAILRGPDGKDLVLLLSSDGIAAYDPRSGEQRWKFEAKSGGIPSATATGNRVYIPAGGLTALDITGTSPSLAWESNKLATANASPVVHDGKVYVLNRAGVLTCGSEEKGDDLWQLRLKGTFWATPVIASDHLYACNKDGQCFVVELGGKDSGAKGKLVHTAEMGEAFYGSPAVAHNALYLRGEKSLFKIAAP
jgi:outer membrane protein assembly factor BamB